MTTEPVNYEAVLADLEARKLDLERTIATIRSLMGTPAPSPDPGGGGGNGSDTPKHGDFLGMSIPEAAKAHLSNVRKKLSTKALIAALEHGGLPSSKYATVYSVLRRREEQVGDIINMKGDWALAAWYPNYTRKSKSPQKSEEQTAPGTVEKKDIKKDTKESKEHKAATS